MNVFLAICFIIWLVWIIIDSLNNNDRDDNIYQQL